MGHIASGAGLTRKIPTPAFDLELYEHAQGSGSPLRAVMTVPKSHLLKIKPVRPAVVVLADSPETLVGFRFDDFEKAPGSDGLTLMADLTARGYVCISTAVATNGVSADRLVADVRALVDLLGRDPRVDRSAIGVAGHACGAKAALLAGAADARIGAILASDSEAVSPNQVRSLSGRPLCLLCDDADTEWSERLDGLPGVTVVNPKLKCPRPSKYALARGYDFLDRHLKTKIEPSCFPPQRQMGAEILWMREICRETNRQIGWPTVCRRRNGEILAVFSGDRDSHVCPYGKVQLVRSAGAGTPRGAASACPANRPTCTNSWWRFRRTAAARGTPFRKFSFRAAVR